MTPPPQTPQPSGPVDPVLGEAIPTLHPKSITLCGVRIVIHPAARRHGITDAEIRAVIEFPITRVILDARKAGTAPVLFIGAPGVNEPDLEVIADLVNPIEAIVFHAMVLRPKLVADVGMEHIINPNYGPQRSMKED